MVVGPTGEIGSVIELRDGVAKKKSGRLNIPIHPTLRVALLAWRRMTTGIGPIIRSERGGPMTPESVVNWFALAYRAVGLAGCSSIQAVAPSSRGRPARTQGRRLAARRSATRRSPVDPDHAAVHRRRHRRPAQAIAVDTLVHNFLHRTGILDRFDAHHTYGPACYRANGCAEIIETVARKIDASQFDHRFPKTFPRFVQHAIWRYCCSSKASTSATATRSMTAHHAKTTVAKLYSSCDRICLSSCK